MPDKFKATVHGRIIMNKGINKENRVELDGFLTFDFHSFNGFWRGFLPSFSFDTVE